jgi:membrane protein YdbS with pleckstrin-like domain
VRKSLKALIVCTTASLVMAIAITIGVGTYWWIWAIWAVLAVGTVALVVDDRRQRA